MIISDGDAVGFLFDGDELCRRCTRDSLASRVVERFGLTSDDVDGLGTFSLMRICDRHGSGARTMTTGTGAYVTDAYDSDDFPKPFEDGGGECMNPDCGADLTTVYHECIRYHW